MAGSKQSAAQRGAVSPVSSVEISPVGAEEASLWARVGVVGLIVVATLLAFANSFTAPLVLDDYYSIVENPTIRHLWPPGTVLSPPAKSGTGGRPVANATFAVSYAMSGNRPWGHHAVSVGIHALTALALFGVVRRTLRQPGLRGKFGDDARALAAAIAIIWAVHPLQTQVVTYVSQRTESLMALFYLLTLYCFIRGGEGKVGQEGRSRLWYALAVGGCVLGMATKEVMVTAPVMVLLYDRIFVAGSWGEAWRRRWGLYAGLAATWFMLGFLMIGSRERDVGFGLGITMFDYALTEAKAVVLYLRLAIWPQPLVFDRGPVLVKSLAEAAPWVAVLAVLVAGTVVALRRWPMAGFAAGWYFIVLAPASSVVPVAQQPIAENRPHLALVAVVALVVLGLFARMGRWSLGLAGVVAVVCGVATLARNRDFADPVGLWRDTVAKAPGNVRAQHNLGAALEKSGRAAEAVPAYEAALAVAPAYYLAHTSLGNALCALGRDAEAIGHYRQGLQIEPRQPKAWINLAIALHRTGQTKEALATFERALAMEPGNADAHYNYGTALQQAGRREEAIVEFRRALAIEPNQPKACNNLGLALQQAGQMKEATEWYTRAMTLDPAYVDPHNNLGTLLGNSGRLDEAIAQWERALRLDPRSSFARDSLAQARRMQQSAAAPQPAKK